MGCLDCEWITFDYLSFSEGSQPQHLKAADMDHVPSHSAFNPAHVIKGGGGGGAAATSGWDGEGVLIQCQSLFHSKYRYLTTVKLLQSLLKLWRSFLINSLATQMKKSCLAKNHHLRFFILLESIKPLTTLKPLTVIHLPTVI